MATSAHGEIGATCGNQQVWRVTRCITPARSAWLLTTALLLSACATSPSSTSDTESTASTTTDAETQAPSTSDETTEATSPSTGVPTTAGETSSDTTSPTTTSPTEEPTQTTGPEVEPAPTIVEPYTPNDMPVVNPERGPYRFVVINQGPDLAAIRNEGISLVYSYVRLDDYREQPISESLLADVQAGLDAAREAGIKVVLRFAYNEGPYPDSEPDAPLEWVYQHIDQVSELLTANEDVLAVVQAGFIGAWGEWHTSTNNLLDHKQEILTALLTAMPATRMTQIRYPVYKQEMFGAPLAANEAYSGSARARVGHHNDCFLASDTDFGTYPEGQIEQWKQFVEDDTHFLVMGGETCNPNPPRSECDTALLEFSRFHYSFINIDFHPEVVAAWQQDGCYGEIYNRLGYRFELTAVERAVQARPGGHHRLVIELDNTGWAAPFNPRALEVVLSGPGGSWRADIDIDPRTWTAGQHHVIAGTLYLPTEAVAGSYSLALALPDPTPSLRDRSEYAIAFTNTTWSAGLNLLGTVELDDAAPGSAEEGQAFWFDLD